MIIPSFIKNQFCANQLYWHPSVVTNSDPRCLSLVIRWISTKPEIKNFLLRQVGRKFTPSQSSVEKTFFNLHLNYLFSVSQDHLNPKRYAYIFGPEPSIKQTIKVCIFKFNCNSRFCWPHCTADRPSYCYAMLIIRNKQGPQKFLIEKTSQASFTNPQQCVSLWFLTFSANLRFTSNFDQRNLHLRWKEILNINRKTHQIADRYYFGDLSTCLAIFTQTNGNFKLLIHNGQRLP